MAMEQRAAMDHWIQMEVKYQFKTHSHMMYFSGVRKEIKVLNRGDGC